MKFFDDTYNARHEALKKAKFKDLNDRATRVLKLRYGIKCNPMTLEGIGKEIGLTRERVRQIELASLKTLGIN